MPIEKLRQQPLPAVEDRLGVLGGAGFVAAGEVAGTQGGEEEDAETTNRANVETK